MNKQNIGRELKQELLKGYDVVSISRWAFQIFSNYKSLDPEIREVLEEIFSMADDPQFELSEKALTQLADRLIEEAKQEDLNVQDLTVKQRADLIGDNWLMCPVCQESWEEVLQYRMVRCPKCNSKLHNPKFDRIASYIVV